MFDKLFTPITIKDMTLRNRIIMPAMGTRFTEDRFVNEKHIAYHVARARGGSALNIVEVSSVHALSAPKMFLSIAEDKYIPKLKELTDATRCRWDAAATPSAPPSTITTPSARCSASLPCLKAA